MDSPGQGGTLPTDEGLACGAVASIARCRKSGEGRAGARLAGEAAACCETQDGIVKEAARQGMDTCTAHRLRFECKAVEPLDPCAWQSSALQRALDGALCGTHKPLTDPEL